LKVKGYYAMKSALLKREAFFQLDQSEKEVYNMIIMIVIV